MSQESLVIEDKGLSDVLSSYSVVVPQNQRSYSWTDDEVKQFLIDITEAMANAAPTYFMGTIVLIKTLDGRHSLR
jgi:uncharacterized protein with ParB-like and HNH nuclease domain